MLDYIITIGVTIGAIQGYLVWSYITHVLEGVSKKLRGAFYTEGGSLIGASRPGAKGVAMFAFSAREYTRITWSGVVTGFIGALIWTGASAEVFLSWNTAIHLGLSVIVGLINVVGLVLKTGEMTCEKERILAGIASTSKIVSVNAFLNKRHTDLKAPDGEFSEGTDS